MNTITTWTAAAVLCFSTLALGAILDGPDDLQAEADMAADLETAKRAAAMPPDDEQALQAIVRINAQRRCMELGGQLFELNSGALKCVQAYRDENGNRQVRSLKRDSTAGSI